nr:MAG TPA: hypothetical protein [Caudoviricetes sp.]
MFKKIDYGVRSIYHKSFLNETFIQDTQQVR